MYHSFDTEIACKYGVNAAVIFNHISFWIEKNAANNSNYYDGEYWTYSSIKGFKEIFCYMSENQIRTALKKLTDNDVLITGNYNKLAYDRTMWYAFGKIGKSIYQKSQMDLSKITNGNDENHKSIYQKSQIDLPKITNGNNENHKPIPDIITDIRTDNKNTDISTYNTVTELFSKICISFPKIVALNEERKKAIRSRLKEYSLEQIEEMFRKAENSDFLTGRICKKGERPFKASFDWLMKPSNFIKVLEGNYDNRGVNNGELRGNPAYRFKTVLDD